MTIAAFCDQDTNLNDKLCFIENPAFVIKNNISVFSLDLNDMLTQGKFYPARHPNTTGNLLVEDENGVAKNLEWEEWLKSQIFASLDASYNLSIDLVYDYFGSGCDVAGPPYPPAYQQVIDTTVQIDRISGQCLFQSGWNIYSNPNYVYTHYMKRATIGIDPRWGFYIDIEYQQNAPNYPKAVRLWKSKGWYMDVNFNYIWDPDAGPLDYEIAGDYVYVDPVQGSMTKSLISSFAVSIAAL